MSTTTNATAPDAPADGKKGRTSSSPVKIAVSGEPSVQLLPPSVRDRAVARSRIRTGVLLVLLGAIVAGGLVAFGTMRSMQAQDALLGANNRTAELLAEQAKYSDIVALAQLVEQAAELQVGATEFEVDWATLFRGFAAVLPEGGELMSVESYVPAPWNALPSSNDAPAPEGTIGTVTLSLGTVTVQDATNSSRAFARMDGVLDVVISRVAVGTDGRVSSLVTVFLTQEAVSGRFAEDAGDDEGADDAESSADADADAAENEEG